MPGAHREGVLEQKHNMRAHERRGRKVPHRRGDVFRVLLPLKPLLTSAPAVPSVGLASRHPEGHARLLCESGT